MKHPTLSLCAVMLCVLPLLSGCGLRTRVLPSDNAEQALAQLAGGSALSSGEQAQNAPSGTTPAEQAEKRDQDVSREPDPNAPLDHDPGAERRAYHEHADAQLVADEENRLWLATPKNAPITGTEADKADSPEGLETPNAALKATEILSQQEAEKLGVSEEAPRADSVFQFYETLLQSKVGSLFECKRLYVYWEAETDYQTVFKTSPEHEIILLSGGYDVAAKRKADALMVDDGWIARKAPGCIVKYVDSSVLGKGIHSAHRARAALDALCLRPGWEAMAAVRTQTVLLLSQELLETRWGRLSAALYLARAMYPDEMSDVDPQEALRLLAQEATGSEIDGVFAYPE